jgi:hypothetical protein
MTPFRKEAVHDEFYRNEAVESELRYEKCE